MGLFSTEAPGLGRMNALPWPLLPHPGPASEEWGGGGGKLLTGAPWGADH